MFASLVVLASASLVVLASASLSACGGPEPGGVATDAGTPADGSALDAGPLPDASSDTDAGRACSTDADCEDGDPTTHAYCQPFFGLCVDTECIEDTECDDGDPCTLDYCLSRSRCGHGSDGTCCASAADCVDAYDCTIDSCDGGHCTWTSTPACGTSCPDRDGDGSGATYCGGTDCDDFDATRAATRAENCTNMIDDDCDDAIDVLDDACRPANLMCPGAPLGADPTHGITVTPGGSTMTTGCGASAFYTMTIGATSDVDVTVTLDTPPPPIAPCPGCPPPSGPMQLDYRAYLETACGDTATDLLGSGGAYCNYWDPGGSFFGGAQTTTYSRRRIAAGTYTLEIQAGPMFAWMAGSTGFTVTARATPSVDAMCDGAPLTAGVAVRGDTMGGLDAFGSACDGTVRAAPERLHPFTLAARSRVRLSATPDVLTGGSSPSVRLAIVSECDAAAATQLACTESAGSTCQAAATVERILEAGSYEALVEQRDGATTAYGLELVVEPVGAACAGASVISASGMTSGTTVGAIDRFRDERVCGGGAGPDVVYRLDLAARSRVVLDLIASYEGSLLRVHRGCGEARVAGGDSPRIDVMLDAGSYDVVVGGARPTSEGSYVLSTTILPI